jgi:hypothetical protein
LISFDGSLPTLRNILRDMGFRRRTMIADRKSRAEYNGVREKRVSLTEIIIVPGGRENALLPG